jgi:hypothetical protein
MAVSELAADLDATSYATVEQADEAAERRGVSAWGDLDDDQKEQALNAATLDLDTLDWIGTRYSSEQVLEWPRNDTDYATDSWPTRLVQATIELAFSYAPGIIADEATDPLTVDPSSGNVKREKVGVIETEFFAPTASPEALATIDRFPPIVRNLVRSLVRVAAGAAWGQGTVRRAS